MQEEDKANRLAELKAEHEEKMAAKRAEKEAEGEEAEDGKLCCTFQSFINIVLLLHFSVIHLIVCVPLS